MKLIITEKELCEHCGDFTATCKKCKYLKVCENFTLKNKGYSPIIFVDLTTGKYEGCCPEREWLDTWE